MNNLVGSAFCVNDTSYGFKLPSICSVFTAELFAILKALEHIELQSMRNFLICSDSLSALQAISEIYPSSHLVQMIQSRLALLSNLDFQVIFVWVPAHVGIVGNETADRTAKNALNGGIVGTTMVPFTDLKAYFKQLFKSRWQVQWDNELNNKLKNVKPVIDPWDSSIRPSRREEVVLTRLRIGHTFLTHSYLFSPEKIIPICEHCDVPLTVNHILCDCNKFDSFKRNLKMASTLPNILQNNSKEIDKLFKFLKLTELLDKF